jgi:hypothetical protein
MSHTTILKVQMKNLDALKAACTALGLPFKLGQQTIKLFSSNVTGDMTVKLPGWQYPVVINSRTGDVSLDNYNEAWGKMDEFHKLSQEYSLQVAEAEAEEFTLQGWTVERQKQSNGDTQLIIQKLSQGL